MTGRGANLRKIAGRAAFTLLLLVLLIYTLFPFYWAIVSSLRARGAMFDTGLLPANASWDNYLAVFGEQPFAHNILNSLLVAGAVVALSLALAVTAAYALGRVNFRGRGALLLAVLAVSMMPQVAVLPGLFELVRWFGLYNQLHGLVLSYLIFTLPFAVWILTTFIRELPKELEEAAIIDGATPWIIVTRVFVPLLAPGLVTAGLLAFIAAWNEFLFALTFTLSNERRTVPVAIALISGGSQHELPWGRIMAASVIVTVPLIVLVLVFQRRIVAGLTAGAVKG